MRDPYWPGIDPADDMADAGRSARRTGGNGGVRAVAALGDVPAAAAGLRRGGSYRPIVLGLLLVLLVGGAMAAALWADYPYRVGHGGPSCISPGGPLAGAGRCAGVVTFGPYPVAGPTPACCAE